MRSRKAPRHLFTTLAHFQTPSEYEAQYNKLRNKEYSRFHGYAYDGIWTLALAVHNVINKLRAQETPKSFTKVTDFQYRNSTWGKLFREALNETDFVGVTVSNRQSEDPGSFAPGSSRHAVFRGRARNEYFIRTRAARNGSRPLKLGN